MSRSILLSIRPESVAKILNGEKTIEVRKQFPKDYVGWVYIYCTKEADLVHFKYGDGSYQSFKTQKDWDNSNYNPNDIELYNGKGKVVARFWCDKIEEMYTDENGMSYYTDTIKKDYTVSKLACLDDSDIYNYLGNKIGYAIHISKLEIFHIPKLEIFDRPRELSELKKVGFKEMLDLYNEGSLGNEKTWLKVKNGYSVKKAPQNYCYVEGDLKWD